MKIFHSPKHTLHNPKYEVYEAAELIEFRENAARMDSILARLELEKYPKYSLPTQYDISTILEVHTQEYFQFLSSAWEEWENYRISNPNNYPSTDYIPSTFASNETVSRHSTIFHKGGMFVKDLTAPISQGTFAAALESVNCALSAADEILGGETFALSLSRPPGHHAGKAFCGGYCYLNNAAIAANYLSKSAKVALLDVDYHAFNGTQDIFYERNDVFTVSLHGDPHFEYPYFSGYAEETGDGVGEGFNLNVPYRKGTTDLEYFMHLQKALDAITDFSPKYLVLSAGVDTHEGDPNGTAKISYSGLVKIGEMIKQLHLPTVIIFEGGYAIDDLGKNFVGLLGGLVR